MQLGFLKLHGVFLERHDNCLLAPRDLVAVTEWIGRHPLCHTPQASLIDTNRRRAQRPTAKFAHDQESWIVMTSLSQL